MYKLAAIGVLIAALAAPASAVGQQARAHEVRVLSNCEQTAVFLPGRNYSICDGRIWMRDPRTGKLVPVTFWRMQHLYDPHLADDPQRPE
jgi:hypothetical protein